MAELRHKDRTIKVKIVYYGPGMSGKTTNIQVLHERASGASRGELVSVNTAQDRTILFDFLPLKIAAFRGLDVQVQLVAVPGQPMYAATRKLALKEVDAVVFVASSAPGSQDENQVSLKEMFENLSRLPGDPASRPLVLQYNKRDLADAVPIMVLEKTLNTRKIPTVQAVAVRGEGVRETFSKALTLTIAELARRYKLADLSGGQSLEVWSAAALEEIFGVDAIAAGPGQRAVHLPLPADVASGQKLDARSNEALVESYAQAAATLSENAQVLRDERDLAQRRLAELLDVLDAARALKPGAPRDSLNEVVLHSLAREVNAVHASLLVPAPNQGFKAAALYHLERDPILSDPDSMPRLRSFLQNQQPRWYETEQDPDLHAILAAGQPPQGSVIAVPLVVGVETIGVVLVYRAPGAAPPRRDALKQLGDLGRMLAPFLESPRTSGADGGAGAREVQGSAFRVAAPRLLQSLKDARQKLADLRRHPDSPVWLGAGLAELAMPLAEATAVSRALTRLETDALEDERVDVSELLGRFRSGEVQVDIGADVTKAKVDPTLLSLAIEALLERARRQAGPGRTVEIRCTARGNRLALHVGVSGPARPPKGGEQALVFAAKVLELHGGSLSVEESGGTGSWVVLDVAAG